MGKATLKASEKDQAWWEVRDRCESQAVKQLLGTRGKDTHQVWSNLWQKACTQRRPKNGLENEIQMVLAAKPCRPVKLASNTDKKSNDSMKSGWGSGTRLLDLSYPGEV